MKDFADLNNSSGSFPSVIGVDASGPGEVDGTELTADYFNQHLGWIQAVLNNAGVTPSGSDEVYNASQILNALKLIPVTQAISILKGQTNNWDYLFNGGTPDHYWESNTNYGFILFPLDLPNIEIDADITVTVQPGAARATTNRMRVDLLYQDSDETLYQIGSSVYDDTTANEQDIVISLSSYTPVANRDYILTVRAGNDGAVNQDQLKKIIIEKSIP